MTDYKPGDVVLAPYPLGQGSSGRKRPALVISSEAYNQATGELIIAQITSRISAPPRPGDYHIQDLQQAKLPRPALVRARLATLKASQVMGTLGTLAEADFQGFAAGLESVLDGDLLVSSTVA
jgi:mRNA interferase MazF